MTKVLKLKRGGYFGVSLDVLMSRQMSGALVPDLIEILVGYLREFGLRTEGIFRVPGSFIRIKELRDLVDTQGIQHLKLTDPHDVAGLLKGFLRELPAPLTSLNYTDFYLQLHLIPSPMSKLFALNMLVLLLPQNSSRLLKVLIDLLSDIVDNHQYNRMNLHALSTVICPNLFAALPSKDRQRAIVSNQYLIEIVEMLIKYRDIVWTVPVFLMKMLRDPCCSSRKNIIKKVKKNQLSESSKSPVFSNQSDSLVLLVSGPFGKSQISVSTTTTAGDVVKTMISNSDYTRGCADFGGVYTGSAQLRLYEVGGNLCERRLSDDSLVWYVHLENPSCTWVVK